MVAIFYTKFEIETLKNIRCRSYKCKNSAPNMDIVIEFQKFPISVSIHFYLKYLENKNRTDIEIQFLKKKFSVIK